LIGDVDQNRFTFAFLILFDALRRA
jgi:hypothetical protein